MAEENQKNLEKKKPWSPFCRGLNMDLHCGKPSTKNLSYDTDLIKTLQSFTGPTYETIRFVSYKGLNVYVL
jgi:hypothetical protein